MMTITHAEGVRTSVRALLVGGATCDLAMPLVAANAQVIGAYDGHDRGQPFGCPSAEVIGLKSDPCLVQGEQADVVSVGKLIH